MTTYTYADSSNSTIIVNDAGTLSYISVDPENTDYAALVALGPLIASAVAPDPIVIEQELQAASGIGSASQLLAGEEGFAFDFYSRTAFINDYSDALSNSGRPVDLLTVSRATESMARGRNGRVVKAAANTIAYHHAPVSWTPRGARILPAATNAAVRSQEFQTTWTRVGLFAFGSGSTADATTAPDGTATADLVTVDTTGAQHYANQGVSGLDGTSAITFSCWIKTAGIRYVRFQMISGANNGSANFDLNTGSATGTTTAAGSTTNVIAHAPEPYLDGWYRCAVTLTLGAAVATVTVRIGALDANQAGTWTGDGTSGLYLWGAQVEQGSYPSAYITTTSAAVTRNADSFTIASSAFPWSDTQGTVAIKARTSRVVGGTEVLFQVDDGTADNRFRIVRDSSSDLRCIVTVATVEVCNLALGTLPADTELSSSGVVLSSSPDFGVAFAWRENDFAASLYGAPVVTDTSGALPTVTTARIGSGSAGNHWASTVASVLYSSRRHGNFDLQRMST